MTKTESYGFDENCIEWQKGDRKACLSLSSPELISQVKEMSKIYKDCKAEVNPDGSVVAVIPVAWITILPPKTAEKNPTKAKSQSTKTAVKKTAAKKEGAKAKEGKAEGKKKARAAKKG